MEPSIPLRRRDDPLQSIPILGRSRGGCSCSRYDPF